MTVLLTRVRMTEYAVDLFGPGRGLSAEYDIPWRGQEPAMPGFDA